MIAEILPGSLWLVIKLLPLLALTAVLFGLFGWWLRRKFHAPVVSSSKPSVPDDLPARERVKKLEHALAKSESGQKSLKHELETLQAKSVSKQALDKASKDLADAQHRLDADLKRIQALEADLKKARETLNTLNSSTAEANKGQRDRTFILENELSKTREALAILEARPDNSLVLQAEIDRLRETLTNSTRVIGELRKQETTSAQALAKTQALLEAATQKVAATPTDAVSLLPAMEAAERNFRKPAKEAASSKVTDAKEAVERLQALNAQKEAERLAAEQAAVRSEQDRCAAAQAAAAQAEQARLAAEQTAAAAQAEQAAAAQAEQERLAAEQAAAAALAEQAAAAALAEQAAAAAQAEQAAAEQAEQERLAAEQAAAAAQAAAAQAEQVRLAAEQAEQARLAAEQAAAEAESSVGEPSAVQQTELELVTPAPVPVRLPATPTEQPQNAD